MNVLPGNRPYLKTNDKKERKEEGKKGSPPPGPSPPTTPQGLTTPGPQVIHLYSYPSPPPLIAHNATSGVSITYFS